MRISSLSDSVILYIAELHGVMRTMSMAGVLIGSHRLSTHGVDYIDALS